MMNRVGLGLAIGAGYVLGRTRKLKLALAVGSVVAGKRMHLSPRAVTDLVSQQLLNNPQFKEIGDQLREDLRGVGQAASGALVERQLEAFADRLHGRTAEVREQLSGAVPTPDAEDEETGESRARDDDRDEAEDSESEKASEKTSEKASGNGTAKRDSERDSEGPARSARQTGKKSAKKAPAKKTAAKKSAAGRTAPKKAAAKRSGTGKTAARKTAGAGGSARGGRARRTKGGEGS